MGTLLWTILIMLTVVVLLWKTSSVARYYLKFATFAVLSLVFATSPIPIMLLNPMDSKNALIPAKLLCLSAKLYGLRYSVKGRENIVKDSGSVVLINHQSALDLIVLGELWAVLDKATVIAKKEVFYMWPFGLAAWLWGTIFIDRLNAEKAQEAVNKTGKTIRDRKARVLMFPEGTRNISNKLLPFKKGAFHLAIASQCPIQPVAVDRYTFLSKHRFDAGDINITILPSIPTAGLTKDDLPSLMDKAYCAMSEFLQQSRPKKDN